MGGKDRDGAQQVVVGFLIGAVTDVQLVHHLFPPPPFHVAQLQDAAPQARVCLAVILLGQLDGPLPAPVAGAVDPVFLPIAAEGLFRLLALFLCHGFHPLFLSARRAKEAAVALLDGHPQHLREFFGLTHLEFTLIFQLAAESVVGDAQNMGHMAQFHALAADAVADHHGIGHRRFSFQFCVQSVQYNHWLYYIFQLIICQHYSQNSP